MFTNLIKLPEELKDQVLIDSVMEERGVQSKGLLEGSKKAIFMQGAARTMVSMTLSKWGLDRMTELYGEGMVPVEVNGKPMNMKMVGVAPTEYLTHVVATAVLLLKGGLHDVGDSKASDTGLLGQANAGSKQGGISL